SGGPQVPLYITLPGATNSVALPMSAISVAIGCWTFGDATGIYPPSALTTSHFSGLSEAPQQRWASPMMSAVPMGLIKLP
nr:hypothetical protein [Candidatus Dormibacteraeota bacterium]